MSNTFTAGRGGLEKLQLLAPDGACAEIYRHGAHVTSWRPANGDERLFLSSTADFSHTAAIRGGVPVIFPQFAALGPLPKHGFARYSFWECREIKQGDRARALFQLQDTPATRAVWPHAFRAELAVEVGAADLILQLNVTNTGTERMSFTAALHTYLRVNDVQNVTIVGLEGLRYIDTAAGDPMDVTSARHELSQALSVAGELDRIYLNAAQPIAVIEAGRRTELRMSGFSDAVVWNPGAKLGGALQDLEPGGYRSMLCVEAAVIGQPVVLEGGQKWSGAQELRALSG